MLLLRDSEEPGPPPSLCQPTALMTGNESDALLGQKSFVLVSAKGMVSDYERCCVTTVLREQQAAIAGA